MSVLKFKAYIYLAIMVLFLPSFLLSQTNKICGITLDDVDNSTSTSKLNNIKNSLSALPIKPTTRIVYYPTDSKPTTPNPTEFDVVTTKLKPVSYIMGQILDSWYWDSKNCAGFNHDNVLARSQAFINNATLKANVDMWEIGNEVNGEWLFNNNYKEVQRTVYDVSVFARAAGVKTVLTLFYNTINCTTDSAHIMMNWVKSLLATYPSIVNNLDYILISYYWDPCEDAPPNWQNIFNSLHQYFPKSKLGMGECGWVANTNSAKKLACINSFYSMNLTVPGATYVIGNFFWTYQEDCIKTYATNKYWLAIKNNVAKWPAGLPLAPEQQEQTQSSKESKDFNVETYPNPFNPTTSIKYSVPVDGNISVKVFDVTGRMVADLFTCYKSAGVYTEKFDGSNLSSGMYYLRIENQGKFIVQKLTLIK